MAWRTTAATQFQPSSLSLSQYNQLILLTYFGLLNYFFQLATGGFFSASGFVHGTIAASAT
jgi:hypothetical protein